MNPAALSTDFERIYFTNKEAIKSFYNDFCFVLSNPISNSSNFIVCFHKAHSLSIKALLKTFKLQAIKILLAFHEFQIIWRTHICNIKLNRIST